MPSAVYNWQPSHLFHEHRWLFGCLALVVLLAGCGKRYDLQDAAARDRPDALDPVEVDLGQFELTLPSGNSNSTVVVDFHVFAKLPKYKVAGLSEALETHLHRFRHDVILRIRKLERRDLNDPSLGKVRQELQSALDTLLPENNVQLVGFYHFRFLEE